MLTYSTSHWEITTQCVCWPARWLQRTQTQCSSVAEMICKTCVLCCTEAQAYEIDRHSLWPWKLQRSRIRIRNAWCASTFSVLFLSQSSTIFSKTGGNQRRCAQHGCWGDEDGVLQRSSVLSWRGVLGAHVEISTGAAFYWGWTVS